MRCDNKETGERSPWLYNMSFGLKCGIVEDLGKFEMEKNHIEEESSELFST